MVAGILRCVLILTVGVLCGSTLFTIRLSLRLRMIVLSFEMVDVKLTVNSRAPMGPNKQESGRSESPSSPSR